MNGEAKGNIYYGLHLYSGLAQYDEPDKRSYKVFLNENVCKQMDPTFAGRPVFVKHVDEIETDINKLKNEADGWVVESFYNQTDGRHWVKFIVVTDKAEQAIKGGMQLSNCYLPKTFGKSGIWNGISYEKEITSAEYEHLAIVPNPRYQESVILTPEQFKKYNEDKITELKRLSNNKNKEGVQKMKLSWFKKTKAEDNLDLESMSVILPKSKKEIDISKLINEMDDYEMKMREPIVAGHDHLVSCNGKTMTVGELINEYETWKNEDMDDTDDGYDAMNDEKQDRKSESRDEVKPKDRDGDGKKKALKLEKEEEGDAPKDKDSKSFKSSKQKNETDDLEARRLAKEKADRLKNAGNHVPQQPEQLMLTRDQVELGKKLF
jgi:hypothetical protein